MEMKTSRRGFLKSSALTGAALTIAFHIPYAQAKVLERMTGQSDGDFEANAFLKIGADDSVTVVIKHLEMGQGVSTGLAMIVADELGADWSKVRVEFAPADLKYKNLFFGSQGTGGSTSIANSWHQLREAGAAAREMLIAAAAKQWTLDAGEIKTENGNVTHTPTKKSTSFGALAALASQMPQPAKSKLKAPSEFTLIGKATDRIDNKEKTSGQALFAMDMKLPGQVTALLLRAPRFGGRALTVDSTEAMKIKGVQRVLKTAMGVAVIADSFWPAKKGRDALKVSWDESKVFKMSTEALRAQYKALLSTKGANAGSRGDLASVKPNAKKTFTADFEFPYLAHAPMEPLNCVLQTDGKTCEVWSGCQSPTSDQGMVANILGIDPSKVKIHTLLAGGSFGRRASTTSDWTAEAAWIAKASGIKAPIHLMWTREDDIKGGFYRPFFLHRVEAGIDESGNPLFWDHKLVGQSFMADSPYKDMVKDGVDPSAVEGLADLSYDVPNLQVELHLPKIQVPTLWWRSVGHTHTAFAAETVIDELAELAGADPVAYRLQWLSKKPRHQGVLKLAAEKAGWGTKPRAGIARGVAVHESFNTFVAAVVEVSIKNKTIKVERVTCAVDCGIVVNPDGVRAQIEGGIGFGLSAALHSAITFEDGKVVQSNFHDYPSLRIHEMPQVEVHMVESSADPTGVGEPGVPVIAPAVANAIAKLTGKRLRRLPLEV